MSAYYIWDPHLVPGDSRTLEFIITQGSTDAIGQGTLEFMQSLLRDIGVDANVVGWSIEPCRTKYYSEYLGEEDWRDNWQLVWRGRATTEKLNALPKNKAPWVETNATDNSWSFENRLGDDAIVNCLVISDFLNDTDLKRAQKVIVRDPHLDNIRSSYSVGEPTFEDYDVPKKYKQLQIDLGKFPGKFFANGADYAEQVIELCKKAKGSVHFAARKL